MSSLVLAASVVLSAFGAVVLCLLVVLYGFTPAPELAPRQAARRQLLIGIGHAVAAACFTATAILIAVVLVQSSRVQSSRPEPAPIAADPRVPALGDQVAGQESRLAQAEARLQVLESPARRAEGDEARPVEPPPRRIAAPVSRKEPPRLAAPSPRVEPPPQRAPVPTVVSPPARAGARPSDVEGSAFTAAPAATTEPAPPPAVIPSPPAPPPPATPSRFNLVGKLREDWSTIRRHFESGGDDLRRAVDDTKRSFRSLVGE